MTIAEWCLRNKATTLIGTLLLVLGGILSFQKLPKAENPDFTVRAAMVMTRYPGAPSSKVESLVTNPIEEKLRELPHLDRVTSQSMPGLSIIAVELLESTDKELVRPTWTKLRNKIDEVTATLPSGVMPPFVNDELGDVFGMVVSLTGDGHSYSELSDTADDLRDALLKIEGVSKVELYGKQDERIYVEFSNNLFAERGITPFLLAQAIDKENTVKPSGEARSGDERILIQSSGEFRTLDELENVSLRAPNSDASIALKDIADVKRDYADPPRSLARHNGKDAMVIAINMASGYDILKVGANVQERLDQLETALPLGYDLDIVSWESKYVDRKISDFMNNLLQAFGFVFIVMLITTGLRTGLIASALIPLAILMCFNAMPVFGISLQQISIASLIIALGIMVDNGVVVSENMLVRLARGEERLQAMNGAVRELWKPLLAASLTTIWAFLPIAMAKSNVGEFCLSLFQVITLTLLSSWLISLTIVPILCFKFIKTKQETQDYGGSVYRAYRGFLLWTLNNRILFVGITVALTALGAIGFGQVKKVFFPPNEREVLLVDIWAPYGSDIRATGEEAAALEAWLIEQPEVANATTFVGTGGPRWNLSLSLEQSNTAYAFMLIEMSGDKEGIPLVAPFLKKAQSHVDANMPRSRITFRQLEQGPPVGAPVQIRIQGEDIPTLYAMRDDIAAILKETPGSFNISDDWGEWRKKLNIEVDQDRVKKAGLTSEDVALSLQLQISGLKASDFREGDKSIPIVIRSKDNYREDVGTLENLHVYSTMGLGSVPLSQVAETKLEFMPPNIRRQNGKRSMTIKAYLQEGYFASDTLKEIEPRIAALANQDKYASYEVEYGGEQEKSDAAQQSIAAGFPLAMGLLFITLVSMFNSISRPVIILLTIVPSIFGIAAGLLVTGASFGFMAMLGALSLMGIIVNNAIMMIDTTENLRNAEIDDANAVIVGSLSRMRPILTTATTTVIGLLPLWFFGGEMWRPMAIVIIFGLAFATVLTLALCPALYSLFFNVRFSEYKWNAEILAKANH